MIFIQAPHLNASIMPFGFLRYIKKHASFVAFFSVVGALVGTILISPITYHISAIKGPRAHLLDFIATSATGFFLIGLPIALVTGALYQFVFRLANQYSVRLLSQRYLLALLIGFIPWSLPMLPYLWSSLDGSIMLMIPLFFSICTLVTIGLQSWAERRWTSLSFLATSEG